MVRSSVVLVCFVALLASVGCQSEGAAVQSWWGPLDSQDEGTPFSSGGQFEVFGFGHRVLTESTPARDLVEVVLVGAGQPVSCAAYATYMQELVDLQAYLDEVMSAPEEESPPAAEWFQYACQRIDGAALEAFGGPGNYRAVHALLDVSDGGPDSGIFRPAPPGPTPGEFLGAEVLVPSTFVSRVYERSRHGEGILPSGALGDWLDEDPNPLVGCAAIFSVLVSELEEGRDAYPDRDALALQAATLRYYHHYTSQQEIQLTAGAPLQVAVTVPDWEGIGSTGGNLSTTLFGQVSREPAGFPYTQVLLSTQARDVPIEFCPELGVSTAMTWPEVEELQLASGDDDDSAGDDDDSGGP